MPWTALATIAAPIVGSLVSSGQASSTAQTSAGIADPFGGQRPQYQQMLSTLMADPSSVSKLPGYQFSFDQGLQALERSQAATGSFGGGTAHAADIQYGENFAMTQFSNWESILAQLAGGNIGNPGAAGQLYSSNMGQSNAALQTGLGALFSGLGNTTFGGGSSGGGTAPSMSVGSTTYTGGGVYNPGLNFGPQPTSGFAPQQ